MLPLIASLFALLSTGSAETLWFPVPLLTDYEFSRTGADAVDGVTTYVATVPYAPATTTQALRPGIKILLVEGSDIAIARVPILGEDVHFACSIGSDNHAQCVRSYGAGTHTNDVYSWTTSVCAATIMPPSPSSPMATGESTPTSVATPSKESPWLPCPTSNGPVPTYKFVMLQWYLYSVVVFIFLLPGLSLLMVHLQWSPGRKVDLTHWDGPQIVRSLIHVPNPSRSISLISSDGRSETASPRNNQTDVFPGQPPPTVTSSSSATDPQTPPNTTLKTSQLASAGVQEPLETALLSAEIDLLAPRTTSVSAFCTQVLSSPSATGMTIEGIETRFSRLRRKHFFLLRVRHESRWAYLRIDMMGNVLSPSPSTLPAVDAPLDERDGPTIRIFDNQTPEAEKLLLDRGMSIATFYSTRWIVEYPDLNPADISQLHRLKSKNPVHHYQLLEIGPENVTSSKTPTLQDLARVLQLLEEEVAAITRDPSDASLLWTIILRTVLIAAHRPQWIIHHHRLSVKNLPVRILLRGFPAIFVTISPIVAFAIFLFKGEMSGYSVFVITVLSVLSLVSTMVLKVLTLDVMLMRWLRQWDARAGIVLSRILERIESRTLEESTLSRPEAVDLYHPHMTAPQRMELFRLESTPTSPTYNTAGLGMGLSLSSHVILEPVPVRDFFPDNVLEPRQTTLGQFCADLRVDRRGSDALIEAVSWRKSRKQPFLHEFILLLVRHGVQYYTVRIDRRGKLNKALDGMLLSGNAMEVVTIEHWQQRNYRALDLFNEHEESYPVATLVSWHFHFPWLTSPGDPELAELAVQQSGTAIYELLQLGTATQLTTARRPKLGDLVVLWETMGREAPRYCLPSYNCYWQSRTMTYLIARRFPREFILRERTIPISSIRQLHTRSFVVGDFLKHWRPWSGVVGWILTATAVGAAWFMVATPVEAMTFSFAMGDQFYDFYYPDHPSLQDLKDQWISNLVKLFGTMTASMILALGPIFFMGWNMNRATKRMWNHVLQTDEVAGMELAEFDQGDDNPSLGPSEPIPKRKWITIRKVFRIFLITFVVWRLTYIFNKLLKDGITRRQEMEKLYTVAHLPVPV